MPRDKDVFDVSTLQRGSHLDPYRILNLPIRSWSDDYGVYRSGILTEELEEIYPYGHLPELKDVCLIPAMLWLIQEMHSEIQELRKKVNK